MKKSLFTLLLAAMTIFAYGQTKPDSSINYAGRWLKRATSDANQSIVFTYSGIVIGGVGAVVYARNSTGQGAVLFTVAGILEIVGIVDGISAWQDFGKAGAWMVRHKVTMTANKSNIGLAVKF